MSYPPPLQPQGESWSYPPPPARISAAAITSLVCGIIGCIPFLTGIVAVLTGIVGIRATKNPYIRGQGLAIAGLVLGLVSLVGWSFASLGAGWLWVASKPERLMAHQFIVDLNAGNTEAASRHCTRNISSQQVADAAEELKSWGIEDATIYNVQLYTDAINGSNGSVTGRLITEDGIRHTFQFRTAEQGNDWKIAAFTFK